MRISTKDLQVGQLIRLADGTKGEVLSIHRSRSFSWSITLKDHLGRIGPRRMNDAGSVEILDSLETHCPYC